MPTPTTPNIAIRFEPDGYLLDGPRLMGRQSAGSGFLRAAVAGLAGHTLYACTPHQRSAAIFQRLVHGLDPAAATAWLPPDRLDLLSRLGTLYLPGPNLAEAGLARLRLGLRAYSLTGITHTIASHSAMDAIAGLAAAPVMPWDALICTSPAVQASVRTLLQAQGDYLQWRLGGRRPPLPRLPIIPLGVHCADFAPAGPDARAAARHTLGIAPEETVALFVGRLSAHAKAHPHPLYRGLEEAARRTGRPLTLVQYGQFANQPIEHSFKDGAARFCPSVRCLWVDGKDFAAGRQVWAAADLFISLSDSIQESFGLTPLEAMAAGLPVVVSDWDGYRDTVREGIDGFRIPTWAPPPPWGAGHALRYETGLCTYDAYCAVAGAAVSVEHAPLVERLCALIVDPALRHRLGQAGRARVKSLYDWPVIFGRYQALWAELAAARRQPPPADETAPPRQAPQRLDPFALFRGYATRHLQPQTGVTRVGRLEEWQALAGHPLFTYLADQPSLPFKLAPTLLAALPPGEATPLATLAQTSGAHPGALTLAVALLAKTGLVTLQPPPASPDGFAPLPPPPTSDPPANPRPRKKRRKQP